MKITMIACDNPRCSATSHPEEGGSKRKLNPPYGWLQLKGGFFGSGPYFEVVVCKADCLIPAIEAVARDESTDWGGIS